jgi:hypothetical protein
MELYVRRLSASQEMRLPRGRRCWEFEFVIPNNAPVQQEYTGTFVEAVRAITGLASELKADRVMLISIS